MTKAIPFNRATLFGNELVYIKDAVQSGVICGDGVYPERCTSLLKSFLEPQSEALLTPSCTDALEICAMLANLQEGDEVILPSFTFVSTATAFTRQGATPVFADISPDTLNIDPSDVAKLISSRTKIIVAVHYGGYPCEMDKLRELADSCGALLIEDAAHALGGTYKSRPLGAIGDLATFSFHETKNITCGEGGALIVNKPSLLDRAIIIRDKGTNRQAFFNGQVDKYTWVDTGSSFVMSAILAAYLLAQLENQEKVKDKRRMLCDLYRKELSPVEESNILQLPQSDFTEHSSAHIFYVLAKSEDIRNSLQMHLANAGVKSAFHYQPLHKSAYAKQNLPPQRELPVTERVAGNLLRLPLFNELGEEDVRYIAKEIKTFFNVN